MQINILQQGAVGDGTTLNTAAIQSAIDVVAQAGGGQVIVPPGVFLTGMIALKDRVRLHLDAGAVLKASPRVEDHPKRELKHGMDWNGGWARANRFHLLVADGCRDIAITGQGTLDGNGTAWYPATTDPLTWPLAYEDARRMATMVEIFDCRDVRIEGVTLTNVEFWTLHLHESDRVWVRGVRIVNPANAPNADGIDITGCRDVLISDCHIDTCDDAICLKTFPAGRSCENVAVTNCVLRTHCVGLKLGCVESFQDIRHVTFSNCIVRGSSRALGLYSRHGATFENIVVSNIVSDTCVPLMFTRPIHLDVNNAADGRPSVIRNLHVSGFQAVTNGRILLTAAAGSRIENVTLRDVTLTYPTLDDPAIRGATVGGSQFSTPCPWARIERAALVVENVRGLRVDGFRVCWPAGECPSAWRFEKKMANGTQQLFTRQDFVPATPVPFAAIALRHVAGEVLTGLESLTGHSGAPVIVSAR